MVEDCVVNVNNENIKEVQDTKSKSKCQFRFNFCDIIIFIFFSAIISLVALFIGLLLYQFFHGIETTPNLWLGLLYGYCSIIIMFMVLIGLIYICCPKMGLVKQKGNKIRPI